MAVLRLSAEVLASSDLPWALVGGLAVSIRTEPRFTRDVDLAVAVVDDSAAERLVSRFVNSGFRLALSLEQTALDRLAAVRLLAPGESLEGIVVDLLFTSTGIEAEICRDAEPLEIAQGLAVPVARAGHLVAMKVLSAASHRPQDAVDLAALIAALDPLDRERAVAAVSSIERVGANRNKHLRAELEEWLARGESRHGPAQPR